MQVTRREALRVDVPEMIMCRTNISQLGRSADPSAKPAPVVVLLVIRCFSGYYITLYPYRHPGVFSDSTGG